MVTRLASNTKRATTTLVVACVLVVVSFSAAGFALIDRFNQTNARRQEQAQVNREFQHTLINLLCFSRDFSLNIKPPLTREKLVQVNNYYSGALQRIGATFQDCPGGTP